MIKKADPTVRCAIYTRKSTDEGLDQEFNTLHAQRESGEAFIKSQPHWVCLEDDYNDGGFTGGNMDRPGLRRLMADIEAGKIDTVVVYKVDRLSRSLLDFARMMEVFDRHNVSFVSVTQQFNTATSMGRLILNVLLSFAQFEREMISERTRDKMAAARRKGKYVGGMPVLGYDVVSSKLAVNEAEVGRVQEMFDLYLQQRSLLAVVKQLNDRGCRTKCWTTKKGHQRGGRPWDKGALHQVLTNPTYVGKVRYRDEIHKGEHEGIVDRGVFDRVQAMLTHNARARGQRNKYGALLKGKLRCTNCDCHMSHTYSSKGNRRYRYYVCTRATQRGWDACPAPSVPAGEIERFVVDQIKCVAHDPALIAETLQQVRSQAETARKRLQRERDGLHQHIGRDHSELIRLPGEEMGAGERCGRMADLQDRIHQAERRLAEIHSELIGVDREVVDLDEVRAALAEFDGVWDALQPREQARLIDLLVERVDFDGEGGNVAIRLRATGIQTLAQEETE